MIGTNDALAVAMRCQGQTHLQLFALNALEEPFLDTPVTQDTSPARIAFNGSHLALQTWSPEQPLPELHFFTPSGAQLPGGPFRPELPPGDERLDFSLSGMNGTWGLMMSQRVGERAQHIFQQLSGCALP